MQSEFTDIALDHLRYSLVWEDSHALYTGLAIQPDDRVLVITSAGCNALNALLKHPRQVIAIDLNPVQNQLLRFKTHLIRHYDYAVFRALMGFDGPADVTAAFGRVAPSLPVDARVYWTSFFERHPDGVLTAGKLEAYIAGFGKTLDTDTRQKLGQLVQFEDVSAQRAFFLAELHTSPFKTGFIQYFDDANLSQGRDPKLFTYAQESGGTAFYNRLLRQVLTTLVRDNFFFRFFFFGPQHLPEAILPPCYQPQQYARLRAQLNRLTIVDGEAVDYLLSAAGQGVNKAGLSNIFEYASQDEFRRVCRLLRTGRERPLRFIFWNLLQEQGADADTNGWTDIVRPDELASGTACFYFRNIRVLTPKQHAPA